MRRGEGRREKEGEKEEGGEGEGRGGGKEPFVGILGLSQFFEAFL